MHGRPRPFIPQRTAARYDKKFCVLYTNQTVRILQRANTFFKAIPLKAQLVVLQFLYKMLTGCDILPALQKKGVN